MTEQPNKQSLASIEADLFGTIFGFHKKFMTLLRESSLDDEKQNAVAPASDRIPDMRPCRAATCDDGSRPADGPASPPSAGNR
jgi:hypothetical protein